jgi:hypothetical protein
MFKGRQYRNNSDRGKLAFDRRRRTRITAIAVKQVEERRLSVFDSLKRRPNHSEFRIILPSELEAGFISAKIMPHAFV